jgi:apoptosis-inducing factor 3
VTELDARSKRIQFADGTALHYDAALACTGGVPKPSDLPGADLKSVHVLRNQADMEGILDSLKNVRRAVVIGASFIGLEAASSLVKRKLHVTVVAPGKVPLAAQFGETLGRMFQRLHESSGVVFRMGANAKAFLGDTAVREVALDNGEKLAADVVIVGTGVRPATDFIHGIALADDGGVPVDKAMRAAPDLFAAGDIAQFPLPRANARVRIEHWRVAQQHARIAAKNMAGGDETYSGVPYFWTYHFGKRFEYLGHANAPDDVVIDGDLDAHAFIAYLIKDGYVAAIVACDREAPTARLAEAMRATLTLEEARRAAAV